MLTIFRLCFVLLLSIFLSFAEEEVDKPLPPRDAAATMIVPEGFKATLFAGEPDIVQPISFAIDDRGRLWVCEAHNYPNHGTGTGDRIVILEDTDNDGQHDKRTVFYDKLNYVSGIEVGFGGAWVMSPPYFYFIPDRDGDGVPDSEPELLLDGFGNHANSHNIANGFAWGPDGWLYGTHGRTNWSLIGKPGTPKKDRVVFDGGVWRFHPLTKKWEPFCDGTTNPWGIDWNEYGEAFMTNCVNPHLFHAIQGAHYEPWRGRESSQYAYRRLDTIADHLHYVAGQGTRENLGSEEVLNLGGGHAHCGSMVYRGGAFPDRYTGTVFMNNIHGKRVNNDILKRSGSGYTASHGPDFVISKDPWFMGVTLQYGPDGSVFVSDWSDTGECHSTRNTRKETGRIFKISHGEPKLPEYDLAKMNDLELVELLSHKNQWWVRHARRNLEERFAAGIPLKIPELQKQLVSEKLDLLWTQHCINQLPDSRLTPLLSDESEYVRGWAVRLLAEDHELSDSQLEQIEGRARIDPSSYVRLQIAAAMQRIAPEKRWNILSALANHEEDASDRNLPMMTWYALEPLVHLDPIHFASFAHTAKIPMIREHVARRIAEHPDLRKDLSILTSNFPDSEESREDILTGILEGLTGSKRVDQPKDWDLTYAKLISSESGSVRDKATELALLFGDPKASSYLKKQIADSANAPEKRNRSLEALIHSPANDTGAYLLGLLSDASVNRTAIRGLANFDVDPEKLIGRYGEFSPAAQQDVLQTLGARKKSASALLDAIEAGRLPREKLSAFTARQIAGLDKNLADRIAKIWGELRAPAKEKRNLIAKYLKELKPTEIGSADPGKGRAHFQTLCAGCHRMFGEGGQVGPELTGSQRTNLEYLLENLIDPSASVSKDYQVNFIETKDGRTLSGFIASQTVQTVTIQSINEQVVIQKSEIATQTNSPISIMPEGLLLALSKDQLHELLAYLSSPHQVALPK